MFYQAIKVNENGKALVCPHCENEAVAQGDYCKICGYDIVNHCSDMYDSDGELISVSCRAILDGDARYCAKCGNESNFFQHGWLGDWKGENIRKAIHNTKSPGALVFRGNKEEKAE